MKQSYCGVATQPEAHLTVNKCRIKNYDGQVYMKPNTEYEIEMFNPTQDV
jgi:hypothetical protein